MLCGHVLIGQLLECVFTRVRPHFNIDCTCKYANSLVTFTAAAAADADADAAVVGDAAIFFAINMRIAMAAKFACGLKIGWQNKLRASRSLKCPIKEPRGD